MKKTKNTIKVKPTSSAKKTVSVVTCSSVWSWSIYAYWFIILFFIASTFYILGRSHEFIHPRSNVTVTEEALMQPESYIESAKVKLIAGDMDAAIADLNAAIDTNASSNTYALRGEAYMQIGNYQKALSDFDSAIQILEDV